MKRKYIKPTTEQINVAATEILAGSLTEDGTVNTGDTGKVQRTDDGDEYINLSKKNLWADNADSWDSWA